MRKLKFEMHEERELFFIMLWILPLIPISTMIIITFHWAFVLILTVWLLLFGYVFYLFHAILIIADDKFIVKTIKKEYVIYFSEILLIKEEKNMGNYFAKIKYKIILKENNLSIPKRLLIIQNKKFTKIYKNINLPNVRHYIYE